ncbi:type IV secretion system protein [Wolbachia pipientis]|uniref:Type IV secretion system protein n=1 Tax=Wolbachia pipientis TaxID=955 RepID=A0A6H2NTC9_WOLPI|nr:type IV secretion system protein [Wolbachia endosymbiont of Aedes albopictus]TVS84519.1 type IV secretion system protein [Wolbachia pipientis]TVS93516.1 type IV secretion system protein [Wolbachia pipientis]UVW83417.1 type IV secretion system protein [Wolbachia endosymbiont of Aedes albopictus]
MLKRLSNQNLGKLCISFVVLFLLSGCGEDHCIKPENLSGLREKLDIVSTEQKWVDSGVNISDRIRVTEIDIVSSKVNFCPKQYADFAIGPGRNDVTLPFALEAGDSISFSVIGSKVCKDKESETKIRYLKIDEKCSEQETEHFAHVLNQEKCQGGKDGICPNKYIIGDAQWLSGREYWFSKLDQDERKKEIENIINSIKQGKNIDCSKLSESSASKIDTCILNLLCGRICKFPSGGGNKGCAYIEYNSVEGEISRSDVKAISKILKEKQIKTDITLLRAYMDDENFEHILGGGICTNCDHQIRRSHAINSELIFTLGDGTGKGGFNIRVIKNHSLENSLYISVSDKFPEHNPDETQGDIPVDISKVHDVQYMESLKEKLKDKTGTIYYGIRDHGCDYKNEGQFSINLTTKEPPTRTFSAIYNFFDEKVKTAFFGSSYKDPNAIHSDTSPVKSLYESFIKSSRTNTIRSTIISLLVLYIILYTLYYFFGLTHISIYEFLIICVKIGVITQLLQDNSWNFFYNNAFSIFINTPKQLIEIANFRGTTSNVFEFLDLPLNRFLSLHSVLLIVSLIFSGPLGIVSFCLVFWGLITVSLSIFNALFSFITSIAIVALLLSLTPIFIICLLFVHTRQMFHNWVKNLARFAIHPVVLLIFISLISQVMDYIIYSVFDFEVCSTCILSINLKIFNPCIFYGYASKYTPNITAMMAFVILGHAMEALVEASSKISDSLFGVYVASEPGKQYQQSLLGIVGLDEQSVQRRHGGGGSSQQSGASRPQIPQRAQGPQGPKIPTGGPQ